MNINSAVKGTKEIENVSSRVKSTKKEIEQLKNELENLFRAGTQNYLGPPISEKNVPEIHPAKPTKPRSPQNPPKTKTVVTQKKDEPTKTSPTKKSKNYNQSDAREYIKKQKEKRAEQLRAQINIADNKVALKKEKLMELHQKALDLVNKNVQLKRERSKSREPPIRLDKSSPRYKSAENLKIKAAVPKPQNKQLNQMPKRSTSQNRLTVPEKIRERPKSQEREQVKSTINERVSRSRARTKPPETMTSSSVAKQKTTNFLAPPKCEQRSDMDKTVLPPENVLSSSVPKQKTTNFLAPTKFVPHADMDKTIFPAFPPTEEHTLLNWVQNEQINSEWIETDRGDRHQSRTKPSETVTSSSMGAQKATSNLYTIDKAVIPLFDPLFEEIGAGEANKQISIENKLSLQEKSKKDKSQSHRFKKPKSVLELAVMTDACAKDTKETQTSGANNFAWMQPKSVLPYPYNFISSVKNKLRHAINSPISCIDVHNSENARTPLAEMTRSKEEIKEMLIKSTSDVKSFASHRGPNLDLKEIENLELISKKRFKEKPQKKPVSKNLFVEYESDSDTSKNIPDISSESLGSMNSKPHLNLTKLKDLKLKKASKSSSGNDTKSDANGYSELDRDNYSSDFQKESVNTTASSEVSGSSIKTVVSEKRTQDSMSSFDLKQSAAQSLSLKEPSFSLSVKSGQFKNDGSAMSKILTKTVTLRSADRTRNLKSPESRESGTSQLTFKSLESEDETSKSATESISENLKTDSSVKSVSSSKAGSLKLKKPSVSLHERKREDTVRSQMKNITLRHAGPNNVNEIHLKFEAEVRLLNDFNESFKQFMAAEKAFENIKTKNETSTSMFKILQNVDTQTSVITKTSTNVSTEKTKESRNSTINYSRGSELTEELDGSILSNHRDSLKSCQNTSLDWNLSKVNESTITNMSIDEERSEISIANIENYDVKNCNSIVSLNFFDHLIKDEDTRIQQLKVIIKIREQALLDRTKTELVWLEIQRKHLIETGKLQEASLLKKKQRGILIKHEQERNEIKKLKQMQKEVSEHRKNTLKQQRNLVKTQLSTENMLSKITVKKKEKRRSMGPLRVVQSCSESIHSETSTSLRSSGVEEILNVTAKSVKVSESSELDLSKTFKEEEGHISNARRSLLMREAALQRRRKTAEELLRWHRKLLEEERKISELEAAATTVVKQVSEEKLDEKQLRQLWKNMAVSDKKLVEDKHDVMSQIALERLCKSARQYSNKNKKTKNGEQSNENSGVSDARKSSEDVNYSSGFEPESGQEIINSQGEKTQISSISELIDNFSRIEDEISTLSKKSEDIVSLKEDLAKTSQFEKTMTPEQETSQRRSSTGSEISSVQDQVQDETIVEELEAEKTKDTLPSEDTEVVTDKPVSEEVSVQDETVLNSDKIVNLNEPILIEDSVIESEKVNEEIPTQKDHQDVKTMDEISTSFEELKSTNEDNEEITELASTKTKEDIEEEGIQSSKSKIISTSNEDIKQEEEVTFIKSKDISTSEDIEEVTSTKSQNISTSNEDIERVTPTKSKNISTSNEDIEEDVTPTKSKSISTSKEDIEEVTSTKSKKTTTSDEVPEEVSSVKSKKTATSDEDLEEIASIKSNKISTSYEDFEEKETATEPTTSKPENLEDEKSLPELTSSQNNLMDQSSTEDVEAISEKISQDEEQSQVVYSVEKQKSTTEETSPKDQTEAISEHFTNKDESKSTRSKDTNTDLSDLEEALESASKIEESLTKLNKQLSGVRTREQVSEDESSPKEQIEDLPSEATPQSESSAVETKTPTKKDSSQIDVKKRVSEILADASPIRGNKSPRLQDLYVTAYDVGAASNSPDNETQEEGRQLPPDIFGSEAEELRKKQLAIEQEIKQLELQQEEQLPYVFMREIPNKPPPPYTPPSSLSSLPLTILPTDVKEINEVASYSSKVLYKAYQNHNLDKVKFSENGFKLFSKLEVSKACAEYVFNVCRDIVRDHYKQFEKVEEPSWLSIAKKPQLTRMKPADASGLERILSQKLKELFGFKKVQVAESAIIKWGRKKRDHVDEVLVIESQEEESQWTNFDKDELIVKNQVTDDIMKMLLEETATVFAKILSKKKSVVG